ncbi:MAG: SsrA-binding protein, partial [Sphaerochaeta sp.]
MKQNNNKIKFLQKNRKAYFNYEVIEDLECGIALMGTEVKSIREGKF